MNVARTLRRTARPSWVAGLVAAAWVNRRELRSALGLGKPAVSGHNPTVLVPAAGDTVTVRTTTATWAQPRRRFHRRTTLQGHPGNSAAVGPSHTTDTPSPTEMPSPTGREV